MPLKGKNKGNGNRSKQRAEERQRITWNQKTQFLVLAGLTLAIKLAWDNLLGFVNLCL